MTPAWIRRGAAVTLLAGLALFAPLSAAHAETPIDLDGEFVVDTTGVLTAPELESIRETPTQKVAQWLSTQR